MAPQVDLKTITEQGVSLLAGHPRGLAAREKLALDAMDTTKEPVELVAPTYLSAITTSFVQGFFGGSVKKFGTKAKLLAHYNLSRLPTPLQEDVNSGLDRLFFSRNLP